MIVLQVRHLFWTVVGFSISAISAFGQTNLIANFSFEELRWPDSEFPCPTSGGAIDAASYWLSAYGSVDYFNACSNEDWPNYGVPQNILGNQEAYDGEAYASFACYWEPWADQREFLWMELPDTLKEGQGYYWEAQVNLADSMNFAMSRLGALFSVENTRYWQQDDFFLVEPQVENPKENLLDNKESWTRVSGQFFAHGGEKFMTIGFFRRDTDDSIQRVSSFPPVVYSWDVSGYCIDAVVLREDNSIGIAEQEQGQLSVYPNPTDGTLYVNFIGELDGAYTLHAFTLDGRQVKTAQLVGKNNTISLKDLSAGIYFIKVASDTNNRFWRGKIILTK